MKKEFHYYATYCAAYIAGYSHEEALQIAYADQFCDVFSKPYIEGIGAPLEAQTTQTKFEMAESDSSIFGNQKITAIWASFHFLPYDLYANIKRRPRRYLNKYRLICKPNGVLVKKTVDLAKGKSLAAIGLAMHVISDTWAHTNFAGTPSYVINNITSTYCIEITKDGEYKVRHHNNPVHGDDILNHSYLSTFSSAEEGSVMNLGHGRIGSMPDISCLKWKYCPAWNDYYEIIKDNPGDYYKAFCQMVYAFKFLRGEIKEFKTDKYAYETVEPYKEEIMDILTKYQIFTDDEWKAFAEKLSGRSVEDFVESKYEEEYVQASEDEKEGTFIGRFSEAAIAQKMMVVNSIYESGNILAGLSLFFDEDGKIKTKDIKRLLKFFKNKNSVLNK